MSLNCGIVGLPNVGKSTLFTALTAHDVPMENYPFCTIEPNRGIVQVPDERLRKLAEIIKPQKTIPAVVEFVDIAGLVAGASRGEGLGNQFLGHIRGVGLIAHVVRCFHDPDVAHVTGDVDPVSDIETVNTELALADLETVARRREKSDRILKSTDRETVKREERMIPVLEKCAAALSQGTHARVLELSDEEHELVRELQLITMKPELYVCNVDEDAIGAAEPEAVVSVKAYAGARSASAVSLSCRIESEIALLDDDTERAAFLEDVGLEMSGLSRFVQAAYAQLGLRTFFTENGNEVRAWSFPDGIEAPAAAGLVHTDFETGFIKAEVYQCEELFELGSIAKVREAGKLRVEGRDYRVRDGDVILFRFNV